MQILRDVRSAVAQIEAQRAVFVDEQAEAAMVGFVELGDDRLPPDRAPASNPDLERQSLQGSGRIEGLIRDQIRARVDRLDGRGRWAEGMQDLVATGSVDVEPQSADLKLIRIRAADVEANDVSGRDAHAIGIGVDSLDGERAVRGDCRGWLLFTGFDRRPRGRDGGGRSQGAPGGRQELASGRIGHVSVRRSIHERGFDEAN